MTRFEAVKILLNETESVIDEQWYELLIDNKEIKHFIPSFNDNLREHLRKLLDIIEPALDKRNFKAVEYAFEAYQKSLL